MPTISLAMIGIPPTLPPSARVQTWADQAGCHRISCRAGPRARRISGRRPRSNGQVFHPDRRAVGSHAPM